MTVRTVHRRTRLATALALVLMLAATLLTAAGPAAQAQPTGPAAGGRPYRSCAERDTDGFRCLSRWTPMPQSGRRAGTAVSKPTAGLEPADIRSAYKLPRTGAKNQTIAIVAAYDNPNAEADLAVYRRAFGMPACTTANGCFRKVDQRGGTTYPEGDPGWGVEIALDVQAVSASCEGCRILLVEADDASFEAIGEAVRTAVRLGADVVSHSYGADEFGGMIELGKRYYTHPGVPMVVASGDYGFQAASFPAVLRSSWAIGGTTLSQRKGAWVEQAWEGSGSACSAYIRKSAVQRDKGCQMRTVSDISATADSPEQFAVYDTYGLGADNGWIAVGGTSLSAPLVAGMIGLAGNAKTVANPSYPYRHRSGLQDVVGGSNGSCGGDYLCTARKGYDAPTGLGSPRGLKSL